MGRKGGGGFQEGGFGVATSDSALKKSSRKNPSRKKPRSPVKKLKVEKRRRRKVPAFSEVVKCPLGLCKLPLVAAVES